MHTSTTCLLGFQMDALLAYTTTRLIRGIPRAPAGARDLQAWARQILAEASKALRPTAQSNPDARKPCTPKPQTLNF